MPVAFPRFSMKKCPMEEMAGVKMREVPDPPRTPKTSMKCQYSVLKVSAQHEQDAVKNSLVHTERSNVLAIKQIEPIKMRSLGPFASKMGPIKMPAKNDKNAYIENIQEISLSP
jgi:hypothetical protein